MGILAVLVITFAATGFWFLHRARVKETQKYYPDYVDTASANDVLGNDEEFESEELNAWLRRWRVKVHLHVFLTVLMCILFSLFDFILRQ